MNDDLIAELRQDVEAIARRALPDAQRAGLSPAALAAGLAEVAVLAMEDLLSLTRRDAAAAADTAYVYHSYRSFRAVLAYRVAHLLNDLGRGLPEVARAARWISEEAKVHTGIEIHPAAQIGRRFVIDHGEGTVIGEQVEIGEDCYVLQQVVLGARAVASTAAVTGRRHPRLGDRVEVAGGVWVLGPVEVGDDCLLEPDARITTDIPAKSRVRVISTVQIIVADRAPEIHGVVATAGGLLLTGAGLDAVRPALLGRDFQLLDFLRVISASDLQIHCGLPEHRHERPWAIGLFCGGELSCYIVSSLALRSVLR